MVMIYTMPALFFNSVLNRSHTGIFASRGASASVTGPIISLKTGTAGGSLVVLTGLLPLYLNQEEHVVVNISTSFAEPRNGVLQHIGMGDVENGAFVGFIDCQFGIYITRMGSRQYWQLKITRGAAQSGTMTLTLENGKQYMLSVSAADTPMVLMQAWAGSEQLLQDNYRCIMGADRVTIISRDCSATGDGSVDFGSTGVTGACEVAVSSTPATRTQWIPSSSFNAVGSQDVIASLNLQNLNIFQITFSQVCTGNILFSVFEPISASMVLLHSWRPADANGFNTSITYSPSIILFNSTPQLQPSRLNTSMANISSGTPAPNAMHTSYLRTVSLKDIVVQAGSDSVVGVFVNPVVGSSKNTLICCITAVYVNTDCSSALRATMLLGGIMDTVAATEQHLPWSSMRVGSAPPHGTVQGGYCMSNMYIKPGMPETVRKFEEFIMTPGSTMLIALTTGLDSASATANIDITVEWQES